MLSIPFNAPSNSSSMSFTYPPTSKISKQSTAIDYCKPSRQNQKRRSPLFNKRSSSPSLRLGHRRRHSPSLHSRVSSFPWSFINLWFLYSTSVCGFCIQLLCVVLCCVFHDTSVGLLILRLIPLFLLVPLLYLDIPLFTLHFSYEFTLQLDTPFLLLCLTNSKMHPNCLFKCLHETNYHFRTTVLALYSFWYVSVKRWSSHSKQISNEF